MISFKKYIKFQKGNIPLIISIPHGGTVKLKEIPKRKNGVIGIDKATIELGKDLITKIEQKIENLMDQTSKCYFIYSKIHRSRIDINREPEKAYNNNSKLARKLYSLYHKKLKEFISHSIKHNGYSILLDIHGFESYKRPEGYRDVDIVLGTNNLKSLFPDSVAKKDRNKNIRGRIIEKFLKRDIPIAPGRPRRSEYILKGGYITQNYGASEIKHSKALQIEFSERIRIWDKKLRNHVVNALTEVLYEQIFRK
jgi:N-formylglutamate amidohydrolase